ncbi:MAG: hypothetical protein K2Q26_09815 [Bdellovibrionales bacterium]|nr:hypothetical protein [Bdellovibrionales bacterium]
MQTITHRILILGITSMGLFLSPVLFGKESRNVNRTSQFVELKKQAETISEEKWKSHIEPRLPYAQPSDALYISWESRLVPPVPAQWPQINKDLIFYVSARGRTSQLVDGERVGPAWGKIHVKIPKAESKPELKFELLTDQIQIVDTVGVRPLRQNEIVTLQSNPLDSLFAEPSAERDLKVKEYFCLEKKVGNFPQDVIRRHDAFFKWLGC